MAGHNGTTMRRQRAQLSMGLMTLLMIAGCTGGYEAEYTRPLTEATPHERGMAFGEAMVECTVQKDRTVGQCRVISASPDTAEVRDAALQGALMSGNGDMPANARPGDRTRRRVVTAGY